MALTGVGGRVAAVTALLVLGACGSAPSGQVQSSPSAAVSPAGSPSTAASPSPSPSHAPSPSPKPKATPTPPKHGSIGLSGCPAYASGQHPLGTVGPPGVGVHKDASLVWAGCGSVVVPPGTARFITGNNWQLGFAATCPNNLNYGVGGMGPNVTFKEILIGGGAGPDSISGAGPWTDNGGGIMAHGGNYQLRITSLDPRCRWRVAIYPS
jgi:hypothetical protein